MNRWHLSPPELTSVLTAEAPFAELSRRGSLVVELYAPIGRDEHQPHTRDEVYVVVNGEGVFARADDRVTFRPGDFLFVPAGVPHRFEQFSEGLLVWVLFYGPEGGEKA